ncbi:hypothetical protein GCM10011428_29330 [Streptomyces violaceus]
MNGFSAGSRPPMTRSPAPSLTALRRLPKARTGSSKNITPKREMTVSKVPGSNVCSCASARTKEAGTPSRSARARAVSVNGPEMSTPTQ